MAIHTLIDLDFTPGIKAEYINQNFNLIYNWLKKERLRVGGWGIVEGFQLSCDANAFTVMVGKGLMINSDGDELEIEATTFGAGEIDYKTVTNKYKVDSEGKITLEDYPYDSKNHRYITYNPPGTIQTIDDDTLYISDSEEFYVPIVRVIGKNIWVNASEYKNTTVTVKQKVANDRIDTIMLHANGEYEYLWSIDSPSPSHVDLADYQNTYCIGVVYWTISDEGPACDFFINHRSYRKVYVDKTNTLYLNGEVYKKPKFIYFEEPDEYEREVNDLWYNTKDNTLYIWRYHDGELGWVIVNDHSEIIIKERKVWYPEDNPEDLQTFKFDKEELNLWYVPGSNALDILIDNAPLMDDQYTEISVNEEEVTSLKQRIATYKSELETKKVTLSSLEAQEKTLNAQLQVARKELAGIKSFFDLTDDSGTYITTATTPQNMNLVENTNATIVSLLEQISSVVSDEKVIRENIEILEDSISIMEGISTGTYVSTGCGFKLQRPLTHASYVEVTVTHEVRMKPARETFQRAAIFVREGDITVTSSDTSVLYVTDAVYSVGDDQLEVFVDGIKLSKWKGEFCEVVDDLSNTEQSALQAETIDYLYGNSEYEDLYYERSSQHFRIDKQIQVGQTISYRVSKHVWSYNQLDKLIKNIKEYALDAQDKAIQALQTVTEIEENIATTLAGIESEIALLKTAIRGIDNCYKRGDKIQWSDIPDRVKDNMIGAPIDRFISAASPNVIVNGIRIEKDDSGIITGGDIFDIHYVSADTNRILVREGVSRPESFVDYWIESTTDGKSVSIELAPNLVSSEAYLYITGFKRGLED